MSWIDDLNSMPDAGTTYRYAPPVRQQPKKKTGRGGTLTSLISEGGALGGVAAGAALGSVVPVLGTAIGGALGGALGAFGGRVAENKVRDDRIGLGDAATEATLTGVLGAPIRSLKYGVNAVKVTKGGGTLADALKAGSKAADSPGVVSRAITRATDKTANNAYTKAIGASKKAKNDFASQYGQKMGSVARKYGITDEDSARAAITPLQNEFDQSFKGVKVDSKDLKDVLTNLYQPYLKGLDIKERGLGKDLKTQVDEILSKYKNSDKIGLEDIVNLRKQFDSKIIKYRTDDSARGFYQTMADGLRDIVRGFGDQQGIKTASGRSVREAGQELSPLYTILKEVQKNAEGPGGTSTLGFRNLLGGNFGALVGGGAPAGVAGLAVTSAANSDLGRKAIAQGANKIATPSAPSNLRTALSGARLPLPGQVADSIFNPAQSSESTSRDMTMPATSIPTTMSAPTMTNALYNSYSNMSTDPALDPANLEQNIATILANGGSTKDAAEYIGLVQALSEARVTPQQKPLSAESAKVVSNAQSGLQSLDALEAMIAEDGGVVSRAGIPGQGIAGGLVGNALGTAGYNNLSRNMLDVITRLRTGAALTASEEAFYKQQLPQAFDRPDVIRQKLGLFRDLFSSVLQKTGQAGSDQMSLMSALNV